MFVVQVITHTGPAHSSAWADKAQFKAKALIWKGLMNGIPPQSSEGSTRERAKSQQGNKHKLYDQRTASPSSVITHWLKTRTMSCWKQQPQQRVDRREKNSFELGAQRWTRSQTGLVWLYSDLVCQSTTLLFLQKHFKNWTQLKLLTFNYDNMSVLWRMQEDTVLTSHEQRLFISLLWQWTQHTAFQ